jgi:hypothetical protein
MKAVTAFVLAFVTAPAVFCQTPAARSEYEVASVKA